MAQCKQSPQEFIKNAFNPQVAVMCTPIAEKCCQKNNLDFIELLQPFSKLSNDVSYKDPTGTAKTVRNLRLTFMDISWRPPQTPLARKLLNSSVSNAPESKNQLFQVGKYNLDIPLNTPWFEAWRDTFLRVQYPSDHEFTKHFLACILVVSSADNTPVETFVRLAQTLTQAQSREPGKLPKWFNSSILKYYVIMHDNLDGDLSISYQPAMLLLFLLLLLCLCFLLRVNSRAPNILITDHLPDPWTHFIDEHLDIKEYQVSTDNNVMKTSLEIGQEAEEVKNIDYHPLSPVNEDLSLGDYMNEEDKPLKIPPKPKNHGACLSSDDVEQVKLLVYEFAKSCLLPYIEKQILVLNDVVSNKKGVSKSIFSATKRWFSANKPGASSVAVNNLIYSPDSPELQIRRLGDLYFMFGNYSLAFQAYHLAKRDYNTDQAWLYYAGALEMAALSAFMANESNRKSCDYMEESIITYLNTCKMPQFSTRATILSAECLKFQNLFGEAAHQLIRMTSEESDLRSALLLEQASYCFLQSKMVRKYAFHMVLAGHRFSKAAQRKYSLRCYKQAYQIYENTGWDLASDHIHYTIGRQANNLHHFDEAVDSFSKLLQGESKQTPQQQAIFLKEYLAILENKLKTESENDQLTSPILPVPELDVNSVKLLVGPTRPLSTPGTIPALGITFNSTEDSVLRNKWMKLEEMFIQEVEGPLSVVFKPMVTLYTLNKLDKNKPVAIVNEPVQIYLKLCNTLQTLLLLKDMYLLWTFRNGDDVITNEIINSNKDEYVKTYITKSVTIEAGSYQELVLSLTPLMTGSMTIYGFSYTLTGSNSAAESNSIKGKQFIEILDSSAKDDQSIVNNERSFLDVIVVPPAPCLQVTFSEIHQDFLADELQRVSVNFQNTSSVPLQNIYMATSVPHLLCNCEFKQERRDNENTIDLSTPAAREKFVRKNHLTSVPLPKDVLEPGQTLPISIWIKAPNTKGSCAIDLLIYYENSNRNSIPRYRLVRHNWNLMVQESLIVDVSSETSHNSKTVEELSLAIKITNLNKVHYSVITEVMLLSVGLLSKYWTLTKDIVTPKYINLHSQESAHILLKAKRVVRNVSEYSSIPLNADKKSMNSLLNTYLAFAKKNEKPSLTMFDDFESYKFKENKDGILLVQWQAHVVEGAKRRIVYGQTQVPIEINRKNILQIDRYLGETFIDISDKTPSEESSKQSADNQVSYNLVYPPIVQHDFENSKLCIVPIKILLHSIVDTKTLSVVVNVTEPSVKTCTNKANLFYSYASSNFCWLGNAKINKDLQPLTTDAVHLAVALLGPGTFDLGAHIQVLCKRSDYPEPFVLQSCQIHSTLIVVNTNS
nr:trafficking protein particle complex subunit 8 [Leptinotarsa decemlineata]